MFIVISYGFCICTMARVFDPYFVSYLCNLSAHSRPNEQNLFGIVQGGLDPRLR